MTNLSHAPGSTEAVLRHENTELRRRLNEAEAITAAIRSGSADAIAIETPAGVRVFIVDTDRPYVRRAERRAGFGV